MRVKDVDYFGVSYVACVVGSLLHQGKL